MCQGLMPWKQTVAASFVAAKAKTSSENRMKYLQDQMLVPVAMPPQSSQPQVPRSVVSSDAVFLIIRFLGETTREEKRLPASLLSTAPFSFPHRSPASACYSFFLYVLLLLHHLFMCPC